MHYHLEMIIPPTDDAEAYVTEVLAPFDEDPDTKEGDEYADRSYSFWDWWIIGGRFTGSKFEAKLGKDKVRAFREELANRKITVSAVQCGKHTLQPASQIDEINKFWNEYFPEAQGRACTLFDNNTSNPDDILLLKDITKDFTAYRVIIAGPGHDGRACASFMIERELYNGVNSVKTPWDGTLESALAMFKEHIDHYRQEWIDAHTPHEDWLVVTVDYHN